MEKGLKKQVVEALKEDFSEAVSVVVTHYSGLTVAEVTKLRQKVRKSGAVFRVTKNSLTKIALKDTQFESIANLFTGPTAVAISNDPVAAAKAVVEFAKDNEKLVIMGGSLNGEVLDQDKIQSLAKLPSLDELRAKLIGMLNTPATRIARLLQTPGGQVARVIKAHSEAAE